MIRRPEELTEPIREAVDHRAVIFSHIVLAVVIAAHTALDPSSKHFEVLIAFALSTAVVLLILLRVFDMTRINSRPRLYIIVYQIFCLIGMSFLSAPATPYLLGVYIVVFISNLYYGSKGVWLTVACFGVSSVAKYIYLVQNGGLSVPDKLNIAVGFFVFAAVCSLFVNYQKVFDWDRARLKETANKEVIEQKRLLALINNMTESVLVLDKDAIIRVYNAATLALFNTNSNLDNKPLDGVIRLEDEKGVSLTAQSLLPAGNRPIERTDIRMRYSDDDVASLGIVVTPIRPNFGYNDVEASYVMTLRDITREKSLEEERDEFISVISHELRTPVTVVEAGISNSMLMADQLGGGEKMAASLKMAHDQSLYLANMLNDLSTFARAEKGTLEMALEEIDPRELLDSLKQAYHEQAEAKGMLLEAACDDSVGASMASNRLYIREILQNFITNAIKYSDKGTITIKAEARPTGVLFSVIDQGIGISVSDQKKVFNKFYRAEDYRTRSTSGTGLGLYITKKLAKILDATFELHSEVGKGSTFAVLVPNKASELAASQPKAPGVHPTDVQAEAAPAT